MEHIITQAQIEAYCAALRSDERSAGTVAKYRRDVTAFADWLEGRPATKETAAGWKAHLLEHHYAPRTVNSMLAAVNGFFKFAGWDIRVKFLKVQHQLFRDTARELTRAEYDRLLTAAQSSGQERLALIMETLCATGIRISELRYITVEAAEAGRATVSLKGKIRTILLSTKLCRELKRLCKAAGVESSKVFPHNFRHLFATIFYRACKDIALLADVLGHSSIETTRIYLTVSGTEQARQLDRLGLVS